MLDRFSRAMISTMCGSDECVSLLSLLEGRILNLTGRN
jgi:hypothetical protein